MLSRSPQLDSARQVWNAASMRVCEFSGVRPSALVAGGAALACIAQARMTAVYLAVVELGLGHRELARVSGLDQPTIGNACRRIEELREDRAIDAAIDAMAMELRRRFPAPAANDNTEACVPH